MTEEKFKQRRQPTNPLEINPNDSPESIMAKVNEMAKNVPVIDPMTRQVADGKLPFAVEGAVPPEFAAMFDKNSKAHVHKQNQQAQQTVAPKPTYTNPKLNALLEGIKETTAQYEEVRLPSLSKFYLNEEAPEGGVLHVRSMTGKEQEILGTQRLLKKGTAINMIFENCVQEKINPEKWLVTDRTYLLIFLRGISHGPLYEVELKCPLCSHRYEANINLDQLFVNFCPKTYSPESLHGELPVTKYKFSFHLPTIADENQTTVYREKKQKEVGDASIDDINTWRMALLLEEIEGLNEHGPLMTLISQLPIADVTHLRSVINDIPFGVDTKIGQWCPSCNEEFEMELPVEASFFFPQPRKVNPIRASN